jgi:hypothetical protein
MSRRDITLFAGEATTTDIVLRALTSAPATTTTLYLRAVGGAADITLRPIGPLNVVVTWAEFEVPVAGASVTRYTRSRIANHGMSCGGTAQSRGAIVNSGGV